MSAQDLTETQIKLVNIIQEKFRKPSATEGMNILRSTAEIHSEVFRIWPSFDYEPSDIDCVLQYLQFDFITQTKGGIAWLITPSS